MQHTYRVFFALAAGACSAPQPHMVRLTPTQPSPPRTTADSVLTVALRGVVEHGLPDFGPRKQVIIVAKDGYPTSSGLPIIDSISFVVVDSARSQQIDDTTGDLNVIWANPPAILGDSAVVDLGNYRVVQRRPRRTGLTGSFSTCSWHLHRRASAWQLDSVPGLCLVS